MQQKLRPTLHHSELNAVNLIDASVFNSADVKIGKVSHVYGEGPELELVADIGGFLLMGPKPVSFVASKLVITREENGHIHIQTTLSDEELSALLEYTPAEQR
jgi:hypothetical protein